jgi:hypothetical protein
VSLDGQRPAISNRPDPLLDFASEVVTEKGLSQCSERSDHTVHRDCPHRWLSTYTLIPVPHAINILVPVSSPTSFL